MRIRSTFRLFSTENNLTPPPTLEHFLDHTLEHYANIHSIQFRQIMAVFQKIQKNIKNPPLMTNEILEMHKAACELHHDKDIVTFSLGIMQNYAAVKNAAAQLKASGYAVEWATNDVGDWATREHVISISRNATHFVENSVVMKKQ
jgi:hypothetical protein